MPKKLTTEQFIQRSQIVHSNKYNYSKTVYTKTHDSVTIICPVHGEFFQTAMGHMKGLGCPTCGVDRRKDGKIREASETFVEKARTVHGDKYDYSRVNYSGTKINITIICPEHGEFNQLPINHLHGKGCTACGAIRTKLARQTQEMKTGTKTPSHDNESFILAAQKKYNDPYDYSKTVYTSMDSYITITCEKHGDFTVKAKLFLYKNTGCNACKRSKIAPKRTTDQYVALVRKVHNNRYDYSKTIVKPRCNQVIITCSTHGDFEQNITVHKNGGGCPKCAFEENSIKSRTAYSNFIERANIVHNNKYEYIESSYVQANKKLTIVCPIHGEFTQQGMSHLHGNGCSECKEFSSKPEKRWLDMIGIPDDKEHRQPMFFFDGVRYKPDGFNPITNTIYEFLGDFWHGNLNRYKSDAKNTISKKTFGELHAWTFERFELFKKNGFSFVYIWESDFEKYEKWLKEKGG